MKKKFLILFMLSVSFVFACFGITACSDDGGFGSGSGTGTGHTHTYTETVSNDYLKSSATCQSKAIYYKSCSCGAKSTETFEYGELGEHNYVDGSCIVCGATTDGGNDNNGGSTDSQEPEHTHTYKDGACTVCGEKEPSEGLSFAYMSDTDSYSVSGEGDCTDTDIVIPSTYNDKAVTSIGRTAFSYCSSLTSITIPDSVTSIGDWAFYDCNKLVEVINKSNLTITAGSEDNGYVAYYAKIVHNGESKIVTVGDYKFITADGVNYLFNYFGTATELTLPKNYNGENYVINDYAFSYCRNLTSVTIGNSVTSIGQSAFNGCRSLEEITLPFIGNTKDGTENTHFGYIFGSSEYAYNHLAVPSSLKKVVIISATSIGERAFFGCSNLTSITIPDSVTSIGDYAFMYCDSLTNIYITDIASWCAIDGLIYLLSESTGNNKSLCLNGEKITNLVIPNGVTSISEYAFYKCSSLTSITIPDSVTSISEYAFYKCSSLTSITIPDSVTSIGYEAFYYCDSLTSVTIGNGVTSIGQSAFNGCRSLEEITLPFIGNTKDGTENTHFGYIFGASEYAYNHGAVPSSLKKVVITSATSIGDYAFYKCSSLTSVTIGNSVTSIGYEAFSYCDSLTSVTIGNGVTSISEYAFYKCSSLTSVTIGNGVTSISEYAFYKCSSLTSITIPDSVTSIGDWAFSGCYKLVEVINKSSLTITAGSEDNGYVAYYAKIVHTGESKIATVDDYQFTTVDGVNYLLGYVGTATELSLPEKYNGENYQIYDYAFSYCSSLTSVTIPDSVTSIGGGAFQYCSSLTSVTIPDSVTSIGYEAFYYCDSLTNITIPDSVTSIGWGAFLGCSKLTTVYYCGTASQWYNIKIGSDNTKLTDATVYYYSESQPATSGKYWHYDENGEIAIW